MRGRKGTLSVGCRHKVLTNTTESSASVNVKTPPPALLEPGGRAIAALKASLKNITQNNQIFNGKMDGWIM